MIKIYFDNVLINDDDYMFLSNQYTIFDEYFRLGSTPSNSFTLKIPNKHQIPKNVKIEDDNGIMAYLIVDDYTIQDGEIITLDLTDKMVLFNKNYDASKIVPCTIKNIIDDMCLKIGIEVGNYPNNSDIEVNFYDNTKLMRDYLSYIAELNSGYAVIGSDGKLYFKQFKNIKHNFLIDECENFKVGQKHKIERVVFDNGILKFETSTDENLETLYLNNENVYILNQDIFNKIAQDILNFEFYNFETGNCVINSLVKTGDLITFGNYQTIAQYKIDYMGGWTGGYSLELKSRQQQETKQIKPIDKIKSINIKLDRAINELEIEVKQIGETTKNTIEEQKSYIKQTITDVLQRVQSIKTIIDNTNEEITKIYSDINQKDNIISFITGRVEEIKNELGEVVYKNELNEMMTFSDGILRLGSNNSEFSVRISKTEIGFYQGETKVAYISNKELYITDALIYSKLTIGNKIKRLTITHEPQNNAFVWRIEKNG